MMVDATPLSLDPTSCLQLTCTPRDVMPPPPSPMVPQEGAYPSTAALRALFTAHPPLHAAAADPPARHLYCLLVSLYLRALAGHYQEEEVAPHYQPLQVGTGTGGWLWSR